MERTICAVLTGFVRNDLLGIADRLSVFIRKPHQISSSLTVCTYRIFLVEIQ